MLPIGLFHILQASQIIIAWMEVKHKPKLLQLIARISHRES